MPSLVAVDPGTIQSAYLVIADGKITTRNIVGNATLLLFARQSQGWNAAIEMFASYGMPIGKSSIETVKFIGQLQEAIESRGGRVRLVYRKEIVTHLCGSSKASDANVSRALKDRYPIVESRKSGIVKDLWSALAIATFCIDNPEQPTP